VYPGRTKKGHVQGYFASYSSKSSGILTSIVKRAIRALESPAYAKAASKKNSLLPPVTDRASAENVFKLLPLSLLALRVSKIDPHEGHNHAKPKTRTKGLWTVKIEQHQETDPMTHYVWLYEGPQWKQKAMAAAVVAGIFAVVLFPLWPIMLRQGVWYLSVGMMGLLGLFFAMSIFRLILFCVTVFVVPPGLWLFPNLFEDVGFIDSFKPLWGWQEVFFFFSIVPLINVLTAYRARRRRKSPRRPSLSQKPKPQLHPARQMTLPLPRLQRQHLPLIPPAP
jgi:protein translocation Sec62 family protein